MTRMSYNPKRSLSISILCNRISTNTATFLTQRSGISLLTRISIKNRFLSQRLKNVLIQQPLNNYLKKVDFKFHCSGNGNVYGGGSSDRSDMTFNKFGKKVHIKRIVYPMEIVIVGTQNII